MPKQAIWNNSYYQNIFLLVLVILTSSCYILCNNVNENITMEQHEEKKKDKNVKNKNVKDKNINNEIIDNKEKFIDLSVYNSPEFNEYTQPLLNIESNMRYQQTDPNSDIMYNQLRYSNRSQAFYNRGFYPNMELPAQVIGCGGRRGPCLGGTQETIPVINSPIEISERNIAPVNIISRTLDPNAVGITRQVGVLYKIFGKLNEIFPLYGVRRYKNSDTWDYFTKVGKEGNFVILKVLTKRVNNNELQTNDVVILDGNFEKFRCTMYDNFPEYVPYFKS